MTPHSPRGRVRDTREEKNQDPDWCACGMFGSRSGHRRPARSWPLGPTGKALPRMPLLSFVVPTLDRQDKVIRAVSSILGQNFRGDLEVIVVDDGSSPPITLPPELASDPRARVVRKERTAGPGAARNTGLTLAAGEWAGFLDSDDYLLPDTLNQRFADAVED